MTLFVGQSDVPRLLPMAECIDAVEGALLALARGEAVLPLRQVTHLPGQNGLVATMPAHVGPLGTVGVKAITVFHGNEGTPFDAHQGAILLFDDAHGRLLAVVDATAVTAIRTAAASAVATRALARTDASELAIIGTGVQARTHLEAMLLVRSIRRVRVCGRDLARARRFAADAALRYGVPVEAAASVRETVEGADVVCTVTSSPEPVLRGAWIAEGAHVNAVGACVPTRRELDTAAVVRARFFVDRRESALREAGDFLIARSEGAVDDAHVVAEIGDVLAGRVEGRRTRDEVTLFESLGLGVEDVAAAHVVLVNAERTGTGTLFDLGGARSRA
jgi:ornithine cyclodeaminase/alanine dehydrogenase-like protein (mu-crystallin family)